MAKFHIFKTNLNGTQIHYQSQLKLILLDHLKTIVSC